MPSLSESIKRLRLARGLTQKEVAQALGLATSTITMYERGQRVPSFEALDALAEYLGVGLTELVSGKEEEPEIMSLTNVKKVPVEGENEALETYMECDAVMRMTDDSMSGLRIMTGDFVYLKRQSMVEHGSLAVVKANGKVMLRRVYYIGDTIELHAANPKYPPIKVKGPVHIIGKALGFRALIE